MSENEFFFHEINRDGIASLHRIHENMIQTSTKTLFHFRSSFEKAALVLIIKKTEHQKDRVIQKTQRREGKIQF